MYNRRIITLDKRNTGTMPVLGTRTFIDWDSERVIEAVGGVYISKDPDRVDWDKSHYIIPPPMFKRFFESSIANYFQTTAEGNRLKEDFKVYVERLKAIKQENKVAIENILEGHGINGEFFQREPLPHQRAGVAFFLTSLDFGCGHICLLDEMRTGKTKQSIDVSRFLITRKMIGRVLVVAPNSVKEIWRDEIRADAPILSALAYIVEGTRQIRHKIWAENALYYIVNYESLVADSALVKSWEKEKDYLLIVDEAHKLKNPETKQSKLITSLKPKYSIFMTGTPVTNSPEDIWTTANFVCMGSLGRNLFGFRKEFAVMDGYLGKHVVEWRNVDEIKRRLAYLSLRRRRKDIMFDQTIYQDRHGDLSGEQKKAYESMRETLYAEYANDKGEWTAARAASAFSAAVRLYQISDGYLSKEVGDFVWFEDKDNWKLREVDEILNDYIEDLGKVVIWSRFVPVIMKLYERYKDRYGALMIRGQMGKKATENMYKFQREPQYKVMVAQIQTSEGRGFQPATTAIMYDQWMSPYLNDQARDRIVGIKNPVSVTIISLITRGAYDERVVFINKNKKGLSESVLGETNPIISIPKLSKEDFLYLIANPEEARLWEKT